MIEITKKYVYQMDVPEEYKGLIPLRDCITMSFFNYDSNKKTYISLLELNNFLTGCLVEILTREGINLNNFNCSITDFFISFSLALNIENKKCKVSKNLYLKYNNKIIGVSENKKDYLAMEPLKMKNIEKDNLLSLMLTTHQLSVSLMSEVTKECSESQKFRSIKRNDKTESKEQNDELCDLCENSADGSEFQQIG